MADQDLRPDPPQMGKVMKAFADYENTFPHAKLTRSDTGILEIALHTAGKSLTFDAETHEEFVELFRIVGQDRDTRVVILTGTGEAFIDDIDGSKFDFASANGFSKMFGEGRSVLSHLLDIPVPLIAAVNGPATVHSEYVLLADVVLATPNTVFQDKPHAAFGIVPGDGLHSLWPYVIGPTRGRYFLATQQVLSAEDAKAFGAVNEIVDKAHLLPRARAIATKVAALPPLTARLTRLALTQPLRRLLDETLSFGLALETLSAALR
jgi:enoyl-CoA hydratase/carnithine racemase